MGGNLFGDRSVQWFRYRDVEYRKASSRGILRRWARLDGSTPREYVILKSVKSYEEEAVARGIFPPASELLRCFEKCLTSVKYVEIFCSHNGRWSITSETFNVVFYSRNL